jgi:hypothetical protein
MFDTMLSAMPQVKIDTWRGVVQRANVKVD